MIDLCPYLSQLYGMPFLFVVFTPQYIQCVYIGTAWILFVLLRNRGFHRGI